MICYLASTKLKRALGYDDSLDCFGVHAVGGIVGALLTGVFVDASLGGAGLGSGVTIGKQVGIQAIAVMTTIVYDGIVSLIILKILDGIMGLRVTEEQESEGLDIALHDERGYNLEAFMGVRVTEEPKKEGLDHSPVAKGLAGQPQA